MRQAGISQSALADFLGMHRSMISQLKSGHRPVSARSLPLLHLLQSATAPPGSLAAAVAPSMPPAAQEDWQCRLQQQELVLLKKQRELAMRERQWQQYQAMEQLLQHLRQQEQLHPRQQRWLAEQSHQQQLKEAGCNDTTRWMLQQEILALQGWLKVWKNAGRGKDEGQFLNDE